MRSCGNPKFKVRGEEGICQQLSGGAGGGGKVGHNCKVMFSGGGGRVGNDCKVINVTAIRYWFVSREMEKTNRDWYFPSWIGKWCNINIARLVCQNINI